MAQMKERRGRLIDEEEKLEFETSTDIKIHNTFDTMALREDLLRGIFAYGFEKPSAIQQRAIVPVITGRDVIAQAQSGTGKTEHSLLVFSKASTQLSEKPKHSYCPRQEN